MINETFLRPIKLQKSFNNKYINTNLNLKWVVGEYSLFDFYQVYAICFDNVNCIEVRFKANCTKDNMYYCVHQSATGS